MNIAVSLILKYLEAHPDQVEKLVAALIDALITHLHKPATT